MQLDICKMQNYKEEKEMAEETLHYYKLNVNRSVGVRLFSGDKDGKVLNVLDPMVEVPEKNLKDFRKVNKQAILQGLIIESGEPEENWETDNALSDDDIDGLLSNWLKLKNTVDKLTSVPILYKILEAASEKGSSKKVTSLVSARIEALEPDTSQDFVDRSEMVSSYDEGIVLSRRE